MSRTCARCTTLVSGRALYCPDCRIKVRAENSQRHYERNKPAIRLKATEWNRTNRERRLATQRKYDLANYARKKAVKYGVPIEEMERLLSVTSCQICGAGGQLVVDHDHSTGLLRGRLCHRCNRAMGMFNDDPDLLDKVVAYLREHLACRI